MRQETRARARRGARAGVVGAKRDEGGLVDLRFRALVGEEAWARLPEAVRRRFSKRLGPGEAIVYQGHVTATELSRAGRVLAFLARAIGGPLPLTNGATGAAVVIVTEDAALGGQSWTQDLCPAGAPAAGRAFGEALLRGRPGSRSTSAAVSA